jgi:phenylalanyl-tRNA synthetase beta chain
MNISYNWLKQYLDIDLPIDKLSELLTDCGLEVEGLEKWESVKGGLKGIVIGEVKTCERHPNADRLSVTTVDVGSGTILPVVCGAPNVAAGQKVLVATVGTKLYSGDEDFTIKKSKIRGEVSEGMICAEDELGLGTSHDGIMVLDEKAEVGKQAKDYFAIEEDYIFEIGLTPNRTDAMSHIGVARDIKAVLENIDFVQNKKENRELTIPDVSGFSIDNTDKDVEVIVENPKACPRYTGLTITGIEVKESPDWLKNRLNAIGLRPINNVVDITNYVLHETGQPLHAFDLAEVKGDKIIVKKMPEGSVFTTLDEVDRKLNANDLMICNAEEGMCIGGVFGGVKSGVTEGTTGIFLECAYFDSVNIRKTSKFHDLQTDSSFRFERGVDPDMIIYTLKRAALLIKEIAGGNISSEIKDVSAKTFERKQVGISWNNIDRLIGKSLGKEVIKNILSSLEFETVSEDENGLELFVPLYRVDVTREADVIEEILRVYGYNNIEIPTKQHSAISHTEQPDAEKLRNTIADYLAANGFNEIMNNSLTKASYYEVSNDFDEKASVAMLNPLSQDLNVMRQSLLFGGLEVVSYNLNHRIYDQGISEFGKVYSIIPGKENESDITKKYKEVNHLALFTTGRKEPESWNTGDDKTDFFYLKAVAGNILKRLGISISSLRTKALEKEYANEGLLFFHNDKLLLELGNFSNKMLGNFDIKQTVYYADINWDLLIALAKKNKISYQKVSKFPAVRRDLALLIDKQVQFEEIEKIAFGTEKKLLKNVNLFDVYEGKNIEEGKKSYAVSFILQDEEKTLTDKMIDKTMRKLMGAYQHKLNATIR